MALEHSYLFHVLKFVLSGQASTAHDLLRLLSNARESMRSASGYTLAGPRNVEDMERVLSGLEEIGALSDRDRHAATGDDRPPPYRGDSGGDGDGGDPGGPAGPGGLGGGRGLAEVLGHPVLFCLPEDAQDALLDSAFGGGSPASDRRD